MEINRICCTTINIRLTYRISIGSSRILRFPTTSDCRESADPTVGKRRIRHPTTSYRNPVPRNPTTSDRILSEVVGFLSEIVGLSGVSCRIRWSDCSSWGATKWQADQDESDKRRDKFKKFD
jgi:hypothetical protein